MRTPITRARFFLRTFASLALAGAAFLFAGHGRAEVVYSQVHSFGFTNWIGRNPQAVLIRAGDGNLYGTTRLGGRADRGTIFRLHTNGTSFGVIHNFYGTNGSAPTCGVIEGKDGLLFGTASRGGTPNKGVVFRVNKDGDGFMLLHEFGTVTGDGASPVGGLLEGSDGLLYGTTAEGGTNTAGTLFKLRKDGGDYAIVRHLSLSEGRSPQGSLIEAGDGRIYGTTSGGGTNGAGVVFGVGSNGDGFAVLHEFGGADGSAPFGALLAGRDGFLYGTTRDGGLSDAGTVFRLTKDGNTFEVLWDFWGDGWDGLKPFSTLVEGTDGGLYGTTAGGGVTNGGIVFRLNKDGSAYQVLWSFGETFDDGGSPVSGLFSTADGRLFGTTFSGGGSDSGTLFSLREDGTRYTSLWSFSASGGDGTSPRATLIEGSDGALYGTTDLGGHFAVGAVFKLQYDGSAYTVLHDFTGHDGAGRGPVSSLVEGTDGFLYGTTSGEETFGTNFSTGTAFRLGRDGSQFTVLHRFLSAPNRTSPDGIRPLGPLLEAADGFLYGVTAAGGTNGFGTFFKLGKDGTFEMVRNFTRFDGGFPAASLIRGSDGVLYGVCAGYSQQTNGTVFRMNLDGSGLEVLRSFSGGDGSVPAAPFVEASDGRLFGSTTNGGLAGAGILFRLQKDGGGFTVLRSFRGGAADGANPRAGLTEGADGALYGTTRNGGANGIGVLFKIGKDGLGYTVLHHFGSNPVDGGLPDAGLCKSRNGALYGATPIGGDLGRGTLYRFGNRFPNLAIAPVALGYLLRYDGVPALPYRLERSVDLSVWRNLTAFVMPLTPFFEFEDTNAPPGAAFYRVRPQ